MEIREPKKNEISVENKVIRLIVIDMYIYIYIYIYIRGVSYRQCRNIQKRGPTEAICLHENERPLRPFAYNKGKLGLPYDFKIEL